MTERLARRSAALAVVGVAALVLLAGKSLLVRELHEMQPASAWLVVEAITPVEPRIALADTLVTRIRAVRYRPADVSRVAMLYCRALDEGVLLSTVWRRVGNPEHSPRQRLGVAVIGYDDAEALPAGIGAVERLPGLEVWSGALPDAPSECETRYEWRVVSSAGAEHVVRATSARVLVGAAAPLEAVEAMPLDPEPLLQPTTETVADDE